MAEPVLEGDPPARTWQRGRAFFTREAEATGEQQPERAALMWMEAAEAAASSSGPRAALADVERALSLCPDAPWLLPRARAMMLRAREFERALKLGQHEVNLGGSTARRVATLVEGCHVMWQWLDQPEVALRLADRAARLSPRNALALTALAGLHDALGAHEEAAAAYQRLADVLTGAPLRRSAALCRAAALREGPLGDLEGARQLLRRALEADSSNIWAAQMLADVCELDGAWAAHGRALEWLVSIVSEPELRTALLVRAGTLHLDRADDLEAACRVLTSAVVDSPDDGVALRRLGHAYEARGQIEELVQVLGRAVRLTPDAYGKAALLTQIGGLMEGELGRPDQALEAYQAALRAVPGYLPAVQSLGTLHRQRGDLEQLLALSNPESEGMLPADARALRLCEDAEILVGHLGRREDAAAAYRRALELQPGFYPAFARLCRILVEDRRHEELAELLAAQIAQSDDPAHRTFLLLRLARLQASALGRLAAARESLEQAGEGDPSRLVELERIDLADLAEERAEQVRLLLEQAAQTSDPVEAEGRRVLAAQLLEARLREPDKAAQIYQQVLESNPASAAAIRGLGRILHERGAWDELIKLHHHELIHHPDRPDKAILLCRLGRILAERLGSPDVAISAYAKALRHDPACAPAMAALERLVRHQRRWPELIKVLEQQAQARNDGPAAAEAFCRAAEIAGWQLDDLDDAERLFGLAIGQHPGLELAREGLLRVQLRRRAWSAAAELLQELIEQEAAGEERRGLWRLQLARTLQREGGDDARLLELYQEAAPVGELAPRLADERIRLLRRQGETRQRCEQLLQLAEATADSGLACSYLLEASFAAELEDEDPELIRRAAAAACSVNPGEPVASWAYERALRRLGGDLALGEHLERQARSTADGPDRLHSLVRGAEALARAGERLRAVELATECIENDAQNLPALRVILECSDDVEARAEAAERLARAVRDRDNRLDAALYACEHWQSVSQNERAVGCLELVWSADDSGKAFERSVELLRGSERGEQLSRLFRQRIGAEADDGRRGALLRQHARLLVEDLGRPDLAAAELKTLLSFRPGDVEALRDLAELHIRQRQWSDGVAALEQIVDSSDDDDLTHATRLRLARVLLHELNAPERARRVLEDAAQARGGRDPEIERQSVELACRVGNWRDARERLEVLVEDEDLPFELRLWALLHLAEVARAGLRDRGLADKCERAALDRASARPERLGLLRRHCCSSDQGARLVSIAEARAEEADDAPRELMMMVARMLLEDLGDPGRAVAHLRRLCEAEPRTREPRLLLATALESQGDGRGAASQYRALIEADPTDPEAYQGLVRVGSPAAAGAAAAVVELFGHAGAAETMVLRTLGSGRLPRGAIPAEEIDYSREFPLQQQILQVLEPHVPALLPQPAPGSSLNDTHPVTVCARQLAASLGIEQLAVEIAPGDGAAVRSDGTLTLRVSTELAADPQQPLFRFWVARALALSVDGGVVLQLLSDEQLDDLLDALHSRRRAGQQQRLRKRLLRELPRKARRHLEQLEIPANNGSVWPPYRRSREHTADRLAVVLSDHPAVALRELSRSYGGGTVEAEYAELLRFVASERYERLSRAVWGE